jgi:hypothetical protein
MRDYSQAAHTWRARQPAEPEEEAPADEETGSLGTRSAHSGKSPAHDHTMDTTASDLTSVKEESGVDASLLQSRQDEDEDEDEEVLDPAELEMLNEEAERMKGIGNRHMANQVRHNTECTMTVRSCIDVLWEITKWAY